MCLLHRSSGSQGPLPLELRLSPSCREGPLIDLLSLDSRNLLKARPPLTAEDNAAVRRNLGEVIQRHCVENREPEGERGGGEA